MTRKKYLTVGLGAILACVAYFALFSKRPPTPSEQYAKAGFTRPTVLAPAAADFGLFINGVDALNQIPKVPSNTPVPFMVQLLAAPPYGYQVLWIVPRTLEQGAEGFDWMDVTCDLFLALNDPKPAPLGEGLEFRDRATFRLEPGTYQVRYYRNLSHSDPEQGPPLNEYLGQGALEITASLSTEPSYRPLETKRNTIKLFRPESEEP